MQHHMIDQNNWSVIFSYLMGQSNSKATYNNNRIQVNLLQSIQEESKKLSEAYSYEFLDEGFCNRVALIYNDQLIKFRRQEIDDVQYTLGIVNENPETKDKVCKMIVAHYINRIRLITKMENNLEYGLDRINAITVGPRCQGNPEIFDMASCQQRGSQWLDTILLPDDRVTENKRWYQQVHNMQQEYIGYLKKLLTILRQLDNFDKYVTDERLKYLEQELDELIEMSNRKIYELYRLILSIPTYTLAEINERNMREKQQRNDYAAKASALRVSKGLPPLNMR